MIVLESSPRRFPVHLHVLEHVGNGGSSLAFCAFGNIVAAVPVGRAEGI